MCHARITLRKVYICVCVCVWVCVCVCVFPTRITLGNLKEILENLEILDTHTHSSHAHPLTQHVVHGHVFSFFSIRACFLYAESRTDTESLPVGIFRPSCGGDLEQRATEARSNPRTGVTSSPPTPPSARLPTKPDPLYTPSPRPHLTQTPHTLSRSNPPETHHLTHPTHPKKAHPFHNPP